MAAKKAAKKTASTQLIPEPGTVVVRMYRIGHGDCFLLAFPGKVESKPVYVLIDCGYKPGSSSKQFIGTSAKEITASIREATGGHIDVAVITHEHQDHVNAISEKNFEGVTIGESWFAWTEDPEDDVANTLRRTFKDKLLGLIAARNRLSASGDAKEARVIDEFLSFEFGGEDEAFDQALALQGLAAAAGESANKKSMKVFKDKAKKIRFIRPHERIIPLRGADDVRVFALGPPRDPTLLESLDPEGDEEFHFGAGRPTTLDGFFAAAASRDEGPTGMHAPFASRYWMAWDVALLPDNPMPFFANHYGAGPGKPPHPDVDEVGPNEEFRRIDKEWLYSAGNLALAMNSQTNNASLVLAFELGKGGKVLLFAADAQRGNWISWADAKWKDGGDEVDARDLLRRTVLYKVGHHGSHNATLNGKASDTHPSLAWMAEGEHAREFTAMITAVRGWAETQNGWDHPLKAIKDALLKKASGRVFQTDTEFEDMNMPSGSTAADWKAFQNRTRADRLYFDYVVEF